MRSRSAAEAVDLGQRRLLGALELAGVGVAELLGERFDGGVAELEQGASGLAVVEPVRYRRPRAEHRVVGSAVGATS